MNHALARTITKAERAPKGPRRYGASALPLVLSISSLAPAQPPAPPAAPNPAAQPPAPASAAPKRKSFTQDLANTTVSFNMAPIPGGSAPDGTEIKPFYMSTTEITWDVYDVWVFSLDVPDGGADASTRPTKPYLSADRGFGHQGYPAISMSFKGAQEFCKWLSAKTGRKYRLPTETEWEHACRAGTTGDWFFGDDASKLGEFAWFEGNAEVKTHQVATKRRNPWGLFDILGNASEWTTDKKGNPVAKGGSFRDSAKEVAASAHVEPTPAWNASDPQIPKSVWWLVDADYVGMRVVCEDEPTK